jgi:signal peptidase II
VAEAERIIGTPDTPDARRPGQEQPGGSGADGTQSAGGTASENGTAPGAARTSGTAETSVPAGAQETAAASERPRGRRRIGVLFAVAVFAYALDLISKVVVVSRLEHHAPVNILGDWLQFQMIRNSGAAFSFGEAYTVIFTVIATAVIVVIVRLARKLHSMPWAIALGLLLGGALGNLTDRIFRAPGVFRGAVVDFISPKHFAVFNLADSAIVCGGILIVLLSFGGRDPDGTVHKD